VSEEDFSRGGDNYTWKLKFLFGVNFDHWWDFWPLLASLQFPVNKKIRTNQKIRTFQIRFQFINSIQ